MSIARRKKIANAKHISTASRRERKMQGGKEKSLI
jgi:hypothetical protein